MRFGVRGPGSFVLLPLPIQKSKRSEVTGEGESREPAEIIQSPKLFYHGKGWGKEHFQAFACARHPTICLVDSIIALQGSYFFHFID